MTRKPPQDRPTAQELRDGQLQDDSKGVRCPRCQCGHMPKSGRRVSWIRHGDGHTTRKVRCRECGYEFLTRETVVGIPPKDA